MVIGKFHVRLKFGKTHFSLEDVSIDQSMIIDANESIDIDNR